MVFLKAILFPRQTIAVKPAAALPKGPAPSAAHKEYQGPIIKEGGKRRFTAATAMSQENGSMLKEVCDYKGYRLRGEALEADWVKDLDVAEAMSCFEEQALEHPLKVLILYGSLRTTSYSRLLALEFARILDKLGADARVYNPEGLPVKDDVSDHHPKVAELRDLSQWSEAHHSPSSRVNGGSQSFNTVNTLRILGRWMRMITIPNQSSVPKAWTEFDSTGRMKPSSLRDRVVDVAEELYKFSMMLRDHSAFLVDRYSERKEKKEKGRLLSQAEKEAEGRKDIAAKG
ncbi:g13482 [Coccomyxa viridis]|uniref:NAD(P)H dehydrogenase (quinone) n=1 Tax=Coccomyxa viridis TaxID=1274662 RepID=A0ABP1GD61_9CHLO